jgi:type IV pilus assembly protein PilW
MRRIGRTSTFQRKSRGFTLVELLIALVISIILLGGLIFTFISVRSTYIAQTGLSQLQDDQRIAVIDLAQVIQEAGYNPSPQTTLATNQFPADATFAQAGQFVVGTGTGATGAGADVVTVRFAASASGSTTSDFILNCNGAANTSTTAVAVFVNQFTVNAAKELTCAVNGGTPVALVGNVDSWAVLYGIDVNGDGTSYRYYNGNSVPAGGWSQVVSARIQLKLANPLANQPGQPATINMVRLVNLMNRG